MTAKWLRGPIWRRIAGHYNRDIESLFRRLSFDPRDETSNLLLDVDHLTSQQFAFDFLNFHKNGFSIRLRRRRAHRSSFYPIYHIQIDRAKFIFAILRPKLDQSMFVLDSIPSHFVV